MAKFYKEIRPYSKQHYYAVYVDKITHVNKDNLINTISKQTFNSLSRVEECSKSEYESALLETLRSILSNAREIMLEIEAEL